MNGCNIILEGSYFENLIDEILNKRNHILIWLINIFIWILAAEANF